jgi:hypothetical protein
MTLARRFIAFSLVLLILAACAPATPPAPTDTPRPTPTPTDIPTATPEPSPTVDPCTYDTSYWSLTPIEPAYTGSPEPHLYRLPACAYEGLKKAVAFHILRNNGWTFPELYQALGHDYGLPYPFFGAAIVATERESGVMVGPRFGLNPYLRAWIFNPETRQYESQFVLGGCYKDVTVWIYPGGGRQVTYPYGCTVVEFLPHATSGIDVLDTPDGQHLEAWGEQAYPNQWIHPYVDRSAPGFKIEHYVAYIGNGVWQYLGRNEKNFQAYPTKDLFDLNFQVFRQREPNLPVMNLAWVKEEFGLEPKPVDWAILEMPDDVRKENMEKIREFGNVYGLTQIFEITPTPKP